MWGSIIGAIIIGIIGLIFAYIQTLPVNGPELATVRGFVTDNDGKPVIGALVETGGSYGTTGSDGGYVVEGVPVNTRTITISVAGAEVVKEILRIIPKGGEIISHNITLPPGIPTPSSTPPTPTPRPMVTPMPEVTVTPMPEVTLTPTPSVAISISEPKNRITVYDDPVIVSGTVKNFTNNELSLWACVKSYDGIWYPQVTLSMTGEETWEAITRPGSPTDLADIDEEFRIVVLVATKEADEELQKSLIGEGDTADGWGLRALPEGANIRDQITVIRG